MANTSSSVLPAGISSASSVRPVISFKAPKNSTRTRMSQILTSGYDRGSPMLHVVLPVGLLQCNCSIFGDEKTRQAIVVDPGDDISKITAILDSHRLKLKAIVITHGHIDHIAGAHKLRSLTAAPIYMNERDREQLDMLDVQAGWL